MSARPSTILRLAAAAIAIASCAPANPAAPQQPIATAELPPPLPSPPSPSASPDAPGAVAAAPAPAPSKLVATLNHPIEDVILHGGDIFVRTHGSEIVRIPKSGGPPEVHNVTAFDLEMAAASEGLYVLGDSMSITAREIPGLTYFAAGSHVLSTTFIERFPWSGGASERIVETTRPSQRRHLVASVCGLAWLTGKIEAPDFGGNFDAIMRMAEPRKGAPETIAVRGLHHAEQLAADGTSFYWSVLAGGGPHVAINRASCDGSATSTLAPNESQPRALTTSATHVYWLAGRDSLRRVAKTGGDVEEIAQDVKCFTIDGEALYVSGKSGIRRSTLTGKSTHLVSTWPRSVVLRADDTSIYYTDLLELRSVPKDAAP